MFAEWAHCLRPRSPAASAHGAQAAAGTASPWRQLSLQTRCSAAQPASIGACFSGAQLRPLVAKARAGLQVTSTQTSSVREINLMAVWLSFISVFWSRRRIFWQPAVTWRLGNAIGAWYKVCRSRGGMLQARQGFCSHTLGYAATEPAGSRPEVCRPVAFTPALQQSSTRQAAELSAAPRSAEPHADAPPASRGRSAFVNKNNCQRGLPH